MVRLAQASSLQFCSRVLQPELHVHLTVHRRRGGQMLLRLLALARAPVELAEAEVAVGDEGTHAEFGGKRHRLPVVVFGGLSVGWIEARYSHGEGPKPIGFNASRLELPGDIDGPLGAFACL